MFSEKQKARERVRLSSGMSQRAEILFQQGLQFLHGAREAASQFNGFFIGGKIDGVRHDLFVAFGQWSFRVRFSGLIQELIHLGDLLDRLPDFVPGGGLADFPRGDLLELPAFKQPAPLRPQRIDGALRLLVSGAGLKDEIFPVPAF
jgi:hypothetical protein